MYKSIKIASSQCEHPDGLEAFSESYFLGNDLHKSACLLLHLESDGGGMAYHPDEMPAGDEGVVLILGRFVPGVRGSTPVSAQLIDYVFEEVEHLVHIHAAELTCDVTSEEPALAGLAAEVQRRLREEAFGTFTEEELAELDAVEGSGGPVEWEAASKLPFPGPEEVDPYLKPDPEAL